MFMADDAGRFSQKTIDKMHLQFGTPKYGWMEIQLSSPDKEIMLNVSDVPCDSLYRLVICQYSDDPSVTYVFATDRHWKVVGDLAFSSVTEAKAGAIECYE